MGPDNITTDTNTNLNGVLSGNGSKVIAVDVNSWGDDRYYPRNTNPSNYLTNYTDTNCAVTHSCPNVLYVGDVTGGNDTNWQTNFTAFDSNIKVQYGLNPAVGRIPFSDGNKFTSSANLYWDDVNGRLGIGTITPTTRLDINGVLRVQGTSVNDGPTYGTEFLTSLGWTSTGWTGDFNNGFTHTIGNTTALTQSTAAVIGTKYQINYTVTNSSGVGYFLISFGGQQFSDWIFSSGGFGPTATTTAGLTVTPSTDFNGKIVFSIKSITATSTPLVIFASSNGTSRIEMRASSSTSNTYIGISSGRTNTTGSYNVSLGSSALVSNTSGSNNIAFGHNALAGNTTGMQNAGMGVNALLNNKSGYSNFAVGSNAMYTNTTGYDNAALGSNALFGNTTGYGNTGVGSYALQGNTEGYNNIAVGLNSLATNTTGYSNVAFGWQAGKYITDGATANTTATNSVYIGSDSRALSDGRANEIVIGASAIGNGSNSVTIGNSSITKTLLKGNVGIKRSPVTNALEVEGEASKTSSGSWVANSDRRIKTDISDINNSLETISKLRPVIFKYTDEYLKLHPLIENKYYYNFIAQEYQTVFPESVKGSGEYLPGDTNQILQLDPYNSQIVAIKAIQELIKDNNDLRKSNNNLIEDNNKLKEQLDALKEELCIKDSSYSWCK